MYETFVEYWLQLGNQVSDPRKRLFVGYLISASVIAISWQVWRGKSVRKSIAALFHAKVWGSQSAKADYAIFVINQAITLLLSPVLLAKLTVASATYHLLAEVAGSPGIFESISPFIATLSFTLVLFLFDDWSRFALHKLMHDVPFLWSLHKVHHSARTLTPLTVYRVHPLEAIIYGLRSSVVQGTCTAFFVFLMGNKLSLLSILGASVFIFGFNILGSNLRHSHVRISYWPVIEKIFISPFQHQLHHSTAPAHYNKNYGSTLAIWDGFSHSLQLSAGQSNPRFGLHRREQKNEHTLLNVYWQSTVDAFTLLIKRLKKMPCSAKNKPTLDQ